MTDVSAKYTQALDSLRSAMEELKKKVAEFDAGHGVTEKASQYLSVAIERAQAVPVELGRLTEQLKTNPAEIPSNAVLNALASANAALTLVQERAKQYDETYHLSSRLSAVVTTPREQAAIALATIGHYAAIAQAEASAKLLGASEALRAKLSQAAAAALPPVAQADQLLHVGELVSKMMAVLSEKASAVDKQFGVSDKVKQATAQAQDLDQRLTGGKGHSFIEAAFLTGWHAINAVHEKYEEAKKEVSKPATSGGSA